MSLYEIYQPSMSHFTNVNPFFFDEAAFSPQFSFTYGSPEISPSLQFLETILSDEYMEFPVHVDDLQDFGKFDHDMFMEDDGNGLVMPLDDNEDNEESHGSHEWISPPPRDDDDHAMMMGISEACMDMASMHTLVLPFEGMEVDTQLCQSHLLEAYYEAMDNQEVELLEAMSHRIIQKVNPVGGSSERVLYYMFQHLNKQPNYLEEESIKNFYLALKAFYQMFPYGKFAHFVANLAILEALPRDVEIIHLIDFDIGEGLQWGSFMDAIKNQHIEIRLTSIKFNQEDESSPFGWRFEETKRRLCDHAKSYGLKIVVEEVGFQDLESLMNENFKKGRKSWYVFNCHMGLPHMRRSRCNKDVLKFLRMSKDFLHQVTCWETSKGIITYGNVDPLLHKTTSPISSYSSFLRANAARYQALLESMDSSFPNHLGEARIALECLFVAPCVSSVELGRKWEERMQCGEVEFGLGLEGWELSEESLVEAKELVKGNSLYGVRIEGEKKNEMVMEWNGTPLVRVSCWKS